MRTIKPLWCLEAVAFLATIVGGIALFFDLADRPVFQATRDGLTLRLENSHWLADHIDHGTGFDMPTSMMPGMPALGTHRLSVEMTAVASGRETVRFDPAQLLVIGEDGGGTGPATDVRALSLRPGEQITAVLEYDVPGEVKFVELVWARDEKPAVFLASATPDHPEKGIPARWPDSSDSLPPGNASAGKRLYVEAGCVSCHGDANLGVEPNLGPGLDGIRAHAGSRVPGASALQYLYDSIIEPNEHIAPACVHGAPCGSPSAMPSYAQRLEPQAVADIIAYLLDS